MRDPLDYADVFIAAMGDRVRVADEYKKWLAELRQRRFWSHGDQEGRRIRWRDLPDASCAVTGFGEPGLYLWGAADLTPRKIGKSKGKCENKPRPLRSRLLHDRYLRPDGDIPSQIQLAMDYEHDVIQCWRRLFGSSAPHCGSSCADYVCRVVQVSQVAFPQCLVQSCRERNRTARLRGAVDFALHRPNDLWVAILPMGGHWGRIDHLEKELQGVADDWNSDHCYWPLVNH
jgi:hypothetical protein